VALQAGSWAAKNIRADLDGKPRTEFHYHDKGIMAMIGRGAAIAEVGKNHHEVHGQLAHVAWMGVHASLMTGNRDKIEAIIDWGWDRFSKTGGPHVLDRGDAAEIELQDDTVVDGTASGTSEETGMGRSTLDIIIIGTGAGGDAGPYPGAVGEKDYR
jgi:NADH dehydrogenase